MLLKIGRILRSRLSVMAGAAAAPGRRARRLVVDQPDVVRRVQMRPAPEMDRAGLVGVPMDGEGLRGLRIAYNRLLISIRLEVALARAGVQAGIISEGIPPGPEAPAVVRAGRLLLVRQGVTAV